MNILEEFEIPSLEEFSNESYNTNNFINSFNDYIDELDNEELNDLKFSNDYSEEDYDNEEYLYYDEIYSNIELSNEYYNNYNKLEDYINISGIISNKVIKDINPDISKEDLNNQVNNNINYIMDKVSKGNFGVEAVKGHMMINSLKLMFRSLINYIKNISLQIRRKMIPLYTKIYEKNVEKEVWNDNIKNAEKNKLTVNGRYTISKKSKAGLVDYSLSEMQAAPLVIGSIGKALNVILNEINKESEDSKRVQEQVIKVLRVLYNEEFIDNAQMDQIISSLNSGKIPRFSPFVNEFIKVNFHGVNTPINELLVMKDWELMNPTNIAKLNAFPNKLKIATSSVNGIVKAKIKDAEDKTAKYYLNITRILVKEAMFITNLPIKDYINSISVLREAHRVMKRES